MVAAAPSRIEDLFQAIRQRLRGKTSALQTLLRGLLGNGRHTVVGTEGHDIVVWTYRLIQMSE